MALRGQDAPHEAIEAARFQPQMALRVADLDFDLRLHERCSDGGRTCAGVWVVFQ